MVITRHGKPKAVLISLREYTQQQRAGAAQLDRLTGEFDALLSGMQRQRSRAAMKAAFGASPKRLGRAAWRQPESATDAPSIDVLP